MEKVALHVSIKDGLFETYIYDLLASIGLCSDGRFGPKEDEMHPWRAKKKPTSPTLQPLSYGCLWLYSNSKVEMAGEKKN